VRISGRGIRVTTAGQRRAPHGPRVPKNNAIPNYGTFPARAASILFPPSAYSPENFPNYKGLYTRTYTHSADRCRVIKPPLVHLLITPLRVYPFPLLSAQCEPYYITYLTDSVCICACVYVHSCVCVYIYIHKNTRARTAIKWSL